jgi:hypothetical protein
MLSIVQNSIATAWSYTFSTITNGYFYLVAVPTLVVSVLYWKQDMLLYVNYLPAGSIGNYVYLPSRFNLPFEDVYITTKDNVKYFLFFSVV